VSMVHGGLPPRVARGLSRGLGCLTVRRAPVAGFIKVKVARSWSENPACRVKRTFNCCVGWALDA